LFYIGNAERAVEKFMQNSVRAGFIKTAPDLSKLFEKL